MTDELIFVILNGSKAARLQAHDDVITTYGGTEGRRRWKLAKKKAKQIIDEGGSVDDLDAYHTHEAMTGMSDGLVDALRALNRVMEHHTELAAGNAYDPRYDPDEGRLAPIVLGHLEAARAALRNAQAIHDWARLSDRVRAALGEIKECPPAAEPCRHGQPWPCQITRVVWALHGKDAAGQVRTARGGA